MSSTGPANSCLEDDPIAYGSILPQIPDEYWANPTPFEILNNALFVAKIHFYIGSGLRKLTIESEHARVSLNGKTYMEIFGRFIPHPIFLYVTLTKSIQLKLVSSEELNCLKRIAIENAHFHSELVLSNLLSKMSSADKSLPHQLTDDDIPEPDCERGKRIRQRLR